jgi:hypothetical protein
MLKMLRREHELRTSDATQARYAEAETRWDTDWMEVTIGLQEQVCTEFGYGGSRLRLALNELRRATYNFPDDAEICAVPLYVRHNRARRGSLRVGDVCPDVPLLAYTVDESAARGMVAFGV